MIFCYGDGRYELKGIGYQKSFYVFNGYVGEKRYNEIFKLISDIMKDVKFDLNSNNSWRDEWKKVPQDVWIKLSQIPEFNKSVVENIIGFTLNFAEIIQFNGKNYIKSDFEKKIAELKSIEE